MDSKIKFDLNSQDLQEDIDLRVRLIKSICREYHCKRPLHDQFKKTSCKDKIYLTPRKDDGKNKLVPETAEKCGFNPLSA